MLNGYGILTVDTFNESDTVILSLPMHCDECSINEEMVVRLIAQLKTWVAARKES